VTGAAVGPAGKAVAGGAADSEAVAVKAGGGTEGVPLSWRAPACTTTLTGTALASPLLGAATAATAAGAAGRPQACCACPATGAHDEALLPAAALAAAAAGCCCSAAAAQARQPPEAQRTGEALGGRWPPEGGGAGEGEAARDELRPGLGEATMNIPGLPLALLDDATARGGRGDSCGGGGRRARGESWLGTAATLGGGWAILPTLHARGSVVVLLVVRPAAPPPPTSCCCCGSAPPRGLRQARPGL